MVLLLQPPLPLILCGILPRSHSHRRRRRVQHRHGRRRRYGCRCSRKHRRRCRYGCKHQHLWWRPRPRPGHKEWCRQGLGQAEMTGLRRADGGNRHGLSRLTLQS